MKKPIAISVLLALSAALSAAQNTLRVPQDYATIQDAVNAASPGDTILVGSGTWCGALVTKRLTIRGDGQASISGSGCLGPIASVPIPAPGEAGITGFLLQKSGTADPSGTVIEHLSFSDVYTAINSFGANAVVVQHNTMQPQRVGVFSRNGSNWTVAYNRIDNSSALQPFRNSGITNQAGSGWTIVHNELTGAYVSVLLGLGSASSQPVNNTVTFNHIDGGFDGAGVDFVAQDGILVANNDIFLPTSAEFQNFGPGCGAWGISASDARGLNAKNSTIINNNTRDTKAGIFIALDGNGGTSNADGLLMRGNLGTLALNQPLSCAGEITGVVKNRSLSSRITCDEDGSCDVP